MPRCTVVADGDGPGKGCSSSAACGHLGRGSRRLGERGAGRETQISHWQLLRCFGNPAELAEDMHGPWLEREHPPKIIVVSSVPSSGTCTSSPDPEQCAGSVPALCGVQGPSQPLTAMQAAAASSPAPSSVRALPPVIAAGETASKLSTDHHGS